MFDWFALNQECPKVKMISKNSELKLNSRLSLYLDIIC